MKRYKIITYGCQANRSDSERIASLLEKLGYLPVNENANLVVINICSVRQSAVDRAQRQVKTLKSSGIKTILTGCIIDKDRKLLEEIADFVLDIKDLQKWPKILGETKEKNIKTTNYFKIPPKHQNSLSYFVSIMTGCDNFCSYCVVPYTRGREQSRPAKEILQEVKNAIKCGSKDIWLLGQNVNSYGVSGKTDAKQNMKQASSINFPKLLKMIDCLPGDFRLSFLTSHPKDMSDELIEIMTQCQKLMSYLHLPVQSGDNQVLKKMNRQYTIAQYKNLVKKIRQKMPKISLSTDIIVGFPGESKQAFRNTIRLFKEVKFDMAYISKYSPRQGTVSFKMKDNVSYDEKGRRFKELTTVLKETTLQKNKELEGKEVEVLVQAKVGDLLTGKTNEYKTARFPGSDELIGSFVKIKIEKALPLGLRGSI